MIESSEWVFYLQLSTKIKEDFLILDQEFKLVGKSLVPIKLKDFLASSKKMDHVDVVIVIKSKRDLALYKHKVKKVIRYLILSGKVSLHILSSFNEANDFTIARKGQYFFHKLPLDGTDFVFDVTQQIHDRVNKQNKWPGARRPKMSLSLG